MLKIQRLDAVTDKADLERKGSVIAVEGKFGWGGIKGRGLRVIRTRSMAVQVWHMGTHRGLAPERSRYTTIS